MRNPNDDIKIIMENFGLGGRRFFSIDDLRGVVRKQYKVLSLATHPDKHPASEKEEWETQFKILQESYSFIADEINSLKIKFYLLGSAAPHAVQNNTDQGIHPNFNHNSAPKQTPGVCFHTLKRK